MSNVDINVISQENKDITQDEKHWHSNEFGDVIAIVKASKTEFSMYVFFS